MKLVLLSLLFTLTAFCGDQFFSKDTRILLDSSLSANQKNLLTGDLTRLVFIKIEGLKSGGNFSNIFGGTDQKAALQYLDKRINIIMDQNIDIDARLSIQNTKKVNSNAVLAALNISVPIWFGAALDDRKTFFKTASQKLLVKDSHNGLVMLGEGYGDKLPSGAALSWTDRLLTLMHESRHSDCTGGIKKDLVKGILDESDEAVQKWISSSKCGHPHINCPKGHALAGLAGCDKNPWGAYSIGAVFGFTIHKYCKNCSELDKQTALAGAADEVLRLWFRNQETWNQQTAVTDATAMLKGQMSKPDMTSAGIIK